NMADFANELLKITAEQKGPMRGKKPPPKRQREDHVIDVDIMEQPFPLPRCFGSRDFLEKNPPMVAVVEKSLILDMGPTARQQELTQDLTAM
ncbi:hypothetical protein A2U01_0046677, partial [Trifolium medium]|nr:hypothetical protein [Trifolium medium]